MKIPFLKDEYWYGGVVHFGVSFPISAQDDRKLDLLGGVGICDQYSPLFLSNRGRLLYSKDAFNLHFCHGEIRIDDCFEVTLEEGYGTLAGARHAAAEKLFAKSGKCPDKRFFTSPQYNTWIELMYDQNQRDILNYARALTEGGMQPGVLMIDEGWAPDYGVYDFAREKFEDPRAMIDELHAMGFSVMLWVTPMISPDGDCFRSLRNGDLLLHDRDGRIAIREWWNGYSAILDFTNPATCAWFREKLHALMERYGVDGFKFDAGDASFYRADDKARLPGDPNSHTRAFNRFGADFALNEFRSVWNCPGEALVTRLQDKDPRWDTRGLGTLLPNMLTQSLLGYAFGCPDMIGGGQYGAFLDPNYRTDEELYLRWLAASLLCPMLQFSISPRRILSPEGFEAVKKLLALRKEYLDHILDLAEHAAHTGEAILRYMELEYPGAGYEALTDQFLLGSDILVAPILNKGGSERQVKIPAGNWKMRNGECFMGPCEVTLSAALDELILLEKI